MPTKQYTITVLNGLLKGNKYIKYSTYEVEGMLEYLDQMGYSASVNDDNVLMGIYAKLIKSDHISDVSKMVEVSQQETLYTEEQVSRAIALYLEGLSFSEIIESLKHKKD